jgi:hypothetical protein
VLFLIGCANDTTNKRFFKDKPSTDETLKGRNKFVKFDDKNYKLSWIDVSRNIITNEYLIEGETLTKWSSMFTSRLFKEAREIKEVFPKYMEQIKPLIAVKPVFYKDYKIESENIVLEVFLIASDKSYYEYNLHIFIEAEDGVRAYQYAQKLPFQTFLDVSNVVKLRASRLIQLRAININFYEN